MPDTVPLPTNALLMMPLLIPTRAAVWPYKPLAISPVMATFAKPMLRTLAVELVAPNSAAMPLAVVLVMLRPWMVWPRPSNWPVNGVAAEPIGAKPLAPQIPVFAVMLASIFAPSTIFSPSTLRKPCRSVPVMLPAAPRLLTTVYTVVAPSMPSKVLKFLPDGRSISALTL